jgi:hypothetical protein
LSRSRSISKGVTVLRASLATSAAKGGRGWSYAFRRAVATSRAVRVSELGNIPDAFVTVLAGGPTDTGGLAGQERQLAIAGFLVPVRATADTEFDNCDWGEISQCYGVPNPLMASHYRDVLMTRPNLRIR